MKAKLLLGKEDSILRMRKKSLIISGKPEVENHNRMLSPTEFNYGIKVKESLKIEPVFPHEVVASGLTFDNQKIDGMRDTKRFISILKQTKRYFIGNQHKAKIFFPKLEKNILVTDNRNHLLTELQLHANVDFLTVYEPHITSSPSVFEARIVKTREYVEDLPKRNPPEVIPPINMGTPELEFEKKLNVIKDNGFPYINAIYASLRQHISKYAILKNFALENGIWVFFSNVPRLYSYKIPASMIHLLQPLGADIVCLEMQPRYPPSEGKTVHEVNPLNVWRFVAELGGHLRTDKHILRFGDDAKCKPSCIVCNGRTFPQFFTEFHNRHLLPVFSNMHECYSSHYELKRGYKRIGDYKNYITQRELLVNALVDMGMNPNQTTLDNF